MTTPLIHVAAAALLNAEGQVLLASRPKGKSMEGLFEFPGGKIHAGETPEAALIRELQEELGVTPLALEPLAFVSHSYPELHVVLLLFLCTEWEGEPEAKEGQELCWAKPQEMKNFPMPKADVPLVRALSERIAA